MRAVASGLLAALRLENPELVVLLELSTGSTPATVYLAMRGEAVSWNGNTYAVRAFEVGDEIRLENQGEGARLTLHVANADAYFQGLIAAGARFIRQACTLRVVEASRLTASPVESVSDRFYVEGYSFTQGQFTLELLPRFGLLRMQVPRGTLTRQEYPGLPRDLGGL